MKDLPAAATQPGSRSLKDGARTRVVAGGQAEGQGPRAVLGAITTGSEPTVAGPVGQQGGHPEPFVFPARKQLPKRTFQDVLKEQGGDEDPETKKKKEEGGETLVGREEAGEAHSVCLWWWGLEGGGLSGRTGY